jgi:hypothetical protein
VKRMGGQDRFSPHPLPLPALRKRGQGIGLLHRGAQEFVTRTDVLPGSEPLQEQVFLAGEADLRRACPVVSSVSLLAPFVNRFQLKVVAYCLAR